jgi:hypothetical protein
LKSIFSSVFLYNFLSVEIKKEIYKSTSEYNIYNLSWTKNLKKIFRLNFNKYNSADTLTCFFYSFRKNCGKINLETYEVLVLSFVVKTASN